MKRHTTTIILPVDLRRKVMALKRKHRQTYTGMCAVLIERGLKVLERDSCPP